MCFSGRSTLLSRRCHASSLGSLGTTWNAILLLQFWLVHTAILAYHGANPGSCRKVLMRLSRKLRALGYYPIPVAGAQIGVSRSEAYRLAQTGDIPTEKLKGTKFKMVPRKRWDRKRKRV